MKKEKTLFESGKDGVGVGVGSAIFNEKGEILLIQRGPKARNERGKWDIPGGSVDFGEEIKTTVVRESKEEMDMLVETIRLLGVFDNILPEEEQHWISVVYACAWLSGGPTIMEPDKCSAYGWFSFEKAKMLSLSHSTQILMEALEASGVTDFRQVTSNFS